jgi:3-deoxy-D-manno-octulosonate 8-phosphate phosphatase (KDO 8-P phosphatase)
VVDNSIVVVLDCDGVLTDGSFYSTNEGKFLKKFGPDDWDALKLLKKYTTLQFITADKKGFEITKRRIETEMGFQLDLVSHKPKERWDWIRNRYPDQTIVYIADGIFDWYCLEKADYSIAPIDSLWHVKSAADHISDRKAGNRFVADACICIMDYYELCSIRRLGLDE